MWESQASSNAAQRFFSKVTSFKGFVQTGGSMNSEELWRAALHDFNNLLAGLQGVLDLSDPGLPFDARNRMRLESTLEDGKTLITMARALALGRHPDAGMASWAEWKSGVEERLEPLVALYRCPVDLVDLGAEGFSWPAPLLQDWVATLTRQILPWAAPGPLRLEATAAPEAWILTWVGDAPLPTALQPEPPVDAPKNLPSFWLQAMRNRLGLAIQATPAGIVVRMARPCAS
jgi:signal transduction histidine kinase